MDKPAAIHDVSILTLTCIVALGMGALVAAAEIPGQQTTSGVDDKSTAGMIALSKSAVI